MPKNLFTSNSKSIKSIAVIVLIAVVLCSMNSILRYNYYQDDLWCRALWHNFYNSENIDNLYLGTSHVFHGVEPDIMNELTGEYNFNLATPAQELISAYYFLKEAIRDNELKHVYLEMHYTTSTGIMGDYSSLQTIKNMWRNTDSMKLSLNKIETVWDQNGKEHIIEAVIPVSRFRSYIFDYNYIEERHEEKNSDEFQIYQHADEDERGKRYFTDKGFYHVDWKLENALYDVERSNEEMFMTDDAKEYLRKICDLCQKENLPLTLFTVPVSDIQMLSVAEGYDNYRQDVMDIANEYGLKFYDFNLVKDEYLPIQELDYFYDTGHLNYEGAAMFSNFWYKVIYTDELEVDDILYSSYSEKANNMPARTWGIYEEVGDESTVYHIASTPIEGSLYKVIATPVDGEPIIIQDFDANTTFEIANEMGGEGRGVITIITRFPNKTESTTEVRYAY